jgi:hypothetical protein
MPELGGADSSHLLECAECAAQLSRQRELRDGLRAVAASDRRMSASSRVEALAVAAFRKQAGLPVRRSVGHWPPAWAGAIAAMLLLGVTLVRERPRRAVEVPATAVIETAASESQGDFDEYIPLPNSAGISASETEDDVNLVHVAVPRSAMIALGVDVSEDRAGELVEADVVLGSDGVARAVKFLD